MTQAAAKIKPAEVKKKDRRSEITERLEVINRELSKLPGFISRLESDFAKAGTSLEAAEDVRRDKVSDQIEQALKADRSPGGAADLILKIPIVEPKLAQLRDTVAKLKDGIDAAQNKFASLTSEKKDLEAELTAIENTDLLVVAFEQFSEFVQFYLKAEAAFGRFQVAVQGIKDSGLKDWRSLAKRCRIDDRFFIEQISTEISRTACLTDYVGHLSRLDSAENKLFDKQNEMDRRPRRSRPNFKQDTGFSGFGFPK